MNRIREAAKSLDLKAIANPSIPLVFRNYNHWTLSEPLSLTFTLSSQEYTLTIPAGYVADGASSPRFLWFAIPQWSRKYAIAAIVHDYLYENHEECGKFAKFVEEYNPRKAADDLLHALSFGWRRFPMWLCLRIFGNSTFLKYVPKTGPETK